MISLQGLRSPLLMKKDGGTGNVESRETKSQERKGKGKGESSYKQVVSMIWRQLMSCKFYESYLFFFNQVFKSQTMTVID